ncbi:Hpt domain-containing protein [Teredinibacter waterburyi]|uniref:Hpt domain-containing protein n=1 Tax=Teredinibacter waterburyi TaxID=1500538 RepID=UPI00165F9E5A|nr:Hpt domain-containing protein [Teredinibacter waterburyi]
MADKRNFAALDWVIGEISDTLKDARQALEAYVEDPKDSTRIRFCLTHIHQVHGSLQMVEFHGASLLAEEMEHLAQALMDHQVTSAPEAQEVLMRSLLQLPSYLDHVKNQKEDRPGIVLPLLNDLRAVRNQSYLSETNLFSPDLSPISGISGNRHPITGDPAKLKQVLKKLREMYQFAAASVLRGIKIEENLSYLDKVFSRLEALTQGTPSHPLWEVSAALVEGLLRDDIELSVAVRGLLRHLARELRILGEKSPGALDFTPRENLLKNLLFYVARADAGGKKVQRVKERYNLDSALLNAGPGDSDRNSLSAPDPEAIRSVIVALSDEINTIKHALDAPLSGHGSPEDLKEVLPVVKRVADTLAVLGIGDLRKQVIIQNEELERLSTLNSIDEERLLGVASRIIEIEHRLEAISKVVGTNRDLATVDEREIEIDQAKITVLRECQLGLEQIKDAIVEYISSKWDKSHLLNVGALLKDIRGGLDMIPLPRPARILISCNDFIQEQLLDKEDKPAWQTLDTLADAIASVEYYLERLSGDMEEDSEGLLDVAESSVAFLGYPVTNSGGIVHAPASVVEPAVTPIVEPNRRFNDPARDVVELENDESDEGLELQSLLTAEQLDEPETTTESETASNAPERAVSLDLISVDDDAEESDIDDEIIEIFIEEAGEVTETLHEYFPQWKENQQDQDALVVVRRAFHTLKGSGRMVEAADIGELAWSVENMLNRVIDNTVTVDPAHAHFIEHVLNLLPTLIESFANKTRNPQRALTDQYMAWGDRLSSGDIPEELARIPDGGSVELPDLAGTAATSEVQSSDIEPIVAAELVAEVDSDEQDENLILWEIFSSEAETHLATMQQFIDHMEQEAPLYQPPSDDLQRALHTLKGSAKMAHVNPIAAMAEPLESFAKELISYQVPINADILQLLRDCVAYTRDGLVQLRRGEMVEISRIEQFVARSAELRQLSVGHLVHLKELAKDGQQKVDPRLLSIFMAEDMNLLLDAEETLGAWQVNPADTQAVKPMVNELTTLNEGAQLANLPDMAGLSAQLLKVYDQAFAGQQDVSDDFFQLLGAGHNALLDMVDAVAAGQNATIPPEDITSSLASLIHAGELLPAKLDPASDQSEGLLAEGGDTDGSLPIATDLPEHAVFDETDLADFSENYLDTSALLVESAKVEAPQEDSLQDSDTALDLGDESLSLYGVETEDLSDDSNENQDASAEASLEHSLNESLPKVDEPSVSGSADAESVDESSVLAVVGLLDNIDTKDEDFDEDIVEVFLEEADELIEELDEAVHSWEADWSDFENAEQIKRALHTLKGGARLAGMTNLGELTHDYESFIMATDLSVVEEGFFATLHDYQDQVLRAVRAVQVFMASDSDQARGADETDIAAAEPLEFAAESNTAPAVSNVNSDVEADEPPAAMVMSAQESNVLPFMPKPRDEGMQQGSGFSMPELNKGNAPAPQQAIARKTGPQEVVKVNSDLLEELVNLAGETSISRGRIQQQVSDFGGSLDEMDATLGRLQEQLRRLDIETEAQILFRQEQLAAHEDFDPLEMDRYSALQQLSRSLIESASDLEDLKATLSDKVRDTETVLLQQSRINTTLQEGLMRSRMVPFSRLVPRLRRIVRQVASELGKQVSFELDNVEGELDRSVLERMVPPLEHMLRNAVDHGVEMPERRIELGKPESGRIVLTLGREGGDVILRLADDGRGVDLKRVREKAIDRGLMAADAELSDFDVMQFILHAGFSTAETVTQISGRGVGMDVVHSEIKQLGGSVTINSEWGAGTEFIVRLPFTVSVNRALMVEIGSDLYAVPLNTIEGIVRVSPFELEHYYASQNAKFEYAGENYKVRYLGTLLNRDTPAKLEGHALPLPVLLVRSADQTMAIQVDALQGSREVVVKALGSQFGAVQGVSGATVMGDGSVVVILDPHALVRVDMAQSSLSLEHQHTSLPAQAVPIEETTKTIMVVDDSVTVRKVTTRFLEREGFDVITAKDGVDALRVLQEQIPDAMLLDIEMPRMDGFEVAKNIRTSSRLKHIPIIMITSRTGSKHRDHAMSLGVNGYMGKPYQEDLLLEKLNELLALAVNPELG